jgi:hypothetical protein
MAKKKPYWQENDERSSELSGTRQDPVPSDVWDAGIDSAQADSSEESQFSRGRYVETERAREGSSDPFTDESEQAAGFETPDQPESWAPAGSSDVFEEERDNMSPKSGTTNASNNLPSFWAADPRENSFYRFAEGIGRVRPDGKGISVAMNIYDSDGNPDGQQICNGEVTANSLDDLLNPPANPDVRFSNTGRITEVPVTTRCQATWRFRDGSTLTAIGKGTSHIVPLSPNIVSRAFGPRIVRAGVMDDAAIMVVTHGTGQYAGARGHVTLDSSVTLPDLDNVPFGKPGAVIHQRSLHTFRVYRGRDVRP